MALVMHLIFDCILRIDSPKRAAFRVLGTLLKLLNRLCFLFHSLFVPFLVVIAVNLAYIFILAMLTTELMMPN